jgi:hypothetical protein
VNGDAVFKEPLLIILDTLGEHKRADEQGDIVESIGEVVCLKIRLPRSWLISCTSGYLDNKILFDIPTDIFPTTKRSSVKALFNFPSFLTVFWSFRIFETILPA